jgi:hypothetical protein
MSQAEVSKQTAALRTISEAEQVVLQQWLAGAPHGVSAYISQRGTDNPAMVQRIVVFSLGTRQPLYSVHSPRSADFWIVTSLVENTEVGLFPTLRAALNFVRPALLL